ncbi:hypothetical protein BD770DRAFT_432638 [Pilaira anomala]|nr:hypothetical protein BD770DRAFT_432638 [Pilaira anomala]
MTDSITIICKSCGIEGHQRRTHWNCLHHRSRLRNQHDEDSDEDNSQRVCKFCGRLGHVRRDHPNCEQTINSEENNSSITLNAGSSNVEQEQQPTSVETEDIQQPEAVRAIIWYLALLCKITLKMYYGIIL